MCGTSPVALTIFLERNPRITRLVLHLDNDRAGLLAARNVISLPALTAPPAAIAFYAG